MAASFPTATSLADVYGSDAPAQRFADLRAAFQAEFGAAPTFLVRAPGRVNLIGEHVDYSGYPVLPMAVDKDILVAARVAPENAGKIRIANLEKDKYPTRTYPNHAAVAIDNTKHEWSNYALCGYRGLLEEVGARVGSPVALDMMLHGTVPPGSGLSSSSALVCAVALTTAYANGVALPKEDFAALSARSEKYVGVEGGGMDQAISFLGERGKAKLIEFNPVRAFDVQLPPGATVVVTNSLVESNKYVTSDTNYNLRVVECRLAAALMAKGMSLPAWRDVRTLSEVQAKSGLSLAELADKARATLRPGAYNKEQLCAALELSLADLDATYGRGSCIPNNPAFKLQDRAVHVYTESIRVQEFRATCARASDADKLAELGRLINESHYSNRDLFEVSCPELEELTSICRSEGALGSRLTGAGWGGCVVSLVLDGDVDRFLTAVRAKYYSLVPRRAERATEASFASKPGCGAVVMPLGPGSSL